MSRAALTPCPLCHDRERGSNERRAGSSLPRTGEGMGVRAFVNKERTHASGV
jgi:hypothetical protein